MVLEKELDRLVQIWATKHLSYLSYQMAECGHHYYSRRIKLLRWDLKNIIPVTFQEHTDIHNGKITVEIKNPFRKIYLDKMAKMDFKIYLLGNNLSEKEFMYKKYEEIKNNIDNQDLYNII